MVGLSLLILFIQRILGRRKFRCLRFAENYISSTIAIAFDGSLINLAMFGCNTIVHGDYYIATAFIILILLTILNPFVRFYQDKRLPLMEDIKIRINWFIVMIYSLLNHFSSILFGIAMFFCQTILLKVIFTFLIEIPCLFLTVYLFKKRVYQD